jgi:hypothetical protein
MRLSVATIVACFVLVLALSHRTASAVDVKKDVAKSSQLVAATGGASSAVQLKDEVKPPKEDKPKKSKGDKDENPDDGNSGGGNDNKPPKDNNGNGNG